MLVRKPFPVFYSRWQGIEGVAVGTEEPPRCCAVVPVLWSGSFDEINKAVSRILDILKTHGSFAAPGFMDPEGIVIYHLAGNAGFKKTLKGDDKPKSLQ